MKNNLPKTIEFNRPKKYKVINRLGDGDCGETVLVFDESMNCYFVVKKYKPYFSMNEHPDDFSDLLNRFKHEAGILFRLNHQNIVRVYSYFDYFEHNTSYIVMEYIDGENIYDFARRMPSALDGIFEKVIDGFSHLEEKGVLHRDIRPMNILVDKDGDPKIIDFGFGKKLEGDKEEAGKSITLNWWCETPPEFSESVYDFQTEIYFVGKLFEQIIIEEEISAFKYMKIVSSMCERDRSKRFRQFLDIRNEISAGKFEELSFSFDETYIYRNFANELFDLISSVDSSVNYERDPDKILNGLELIYRQSMLEENVHNSSKIASIFIKGSFRYWTNKKVNTETLSDFLSMLKSLPSDKRSVVLENIVNRLDSIKKTYSENDLDEEIPF